MEQKECRSCKAPIFWATTPNDRKVPLDYEASSDGNWVVERVTLDGVRCARLPNDAAAVYTGEKFRSHFETCPDAKDWSKR